MTSRYEIITGKIIYENNDNKFDWAWFLGRIDPTISVKVWCATEAETKDFLDRRKAYLIKDDNTLQGFHFSWKQEEIWDDNFKGILFTRTNHIHMRVIPDPSEAIYWSYYM